MTERFDRPSAVTHKDGEVIVRGPDDVAVSFTPEAALATANRLESEAMDALLERGNTVVKPPAKAG